MPDGERILGLLPNMTPRTQTRREIFLERMDGLIPGKSWKSASARWKPGPGPPALPAAGDARIHCVQLFYNLSDPGMEDLLYEAESQEVRGSESHSPDETTILNFRHLLERHERGAKGCSMRSTPTWSRRDCAEGGNPVDASIIEAPSSTKNRALSRTRCIRKKGNQWHFGPMKAHIGVDSETGKK